MISQKMTDAFNVQTAKEFYSSYLYLSMAAYLANSGLTGFAQWMKVQAKEEAFHAERLFDYVIERGGQVSLKAIDAPEKEWGSLSKVYEMMLRHEEHITSSLNELADVAEAEKDRAAYSLIQRFIDEQVEEENTARDIVAKLKLIGDSGSGIFNLDKEFAARTYVQPTL